MTIHTAHRYPNGDELIRMQRPANWDDHRHCYICNIGNDTLSSLYAIAFKAGGFSGWRAVCHKHAKQALAKEFGIPMHAGTKLYQTCEVRCCEAGNVKQIRVIELTGRSMDIWLCSFHEAEALQAKIDNRVTDFIMSHIW